MSGHAVEAVHMLVTASWAAPTFTGVGPAPAPVRLATGAGPVVVCFPSLVPHAEHEYTRFAGGLDAPVHLLPHPGYGPAAAVPDSLDTLVATHARSVLEVAGDRPCVLVGRSTGGAVAQAVAERLAERAAGLVLIDTYHLDDHDITQDWLVGLPARHAFESGAGFDATPDATLLAMGAYTRLFLGWRPTAPACPTLVVRPRSRAARMPETGWRSTWPVPHDSMELPGDHFTLLEEHADSTADAVRTWISTL
jgi:thioesterase domain-containing protein